MLIAVFQMSIQPVNLCLVSDNGLQGFCDELKRKRYSKFQENE